MFKQFAVPLSLMLLSILAAACLAGPLHAATGGAPEQGAAAPADKSIKAGEAFPGIALAGKLSPDEIAYLGLDGRQEPFRLSQIVAPFVLVEVFSMYCPYCQRESGTVNDLYRLIQNSEYRDKLKLIGIGAGNSQYEVDFFRKKYEVPFPLFIDPDFAVHKAVGSVGTPFFYVLARDQKTDEMRVVFSHVGPTGGSESFLRRIVEETGLKR
jgi:peroxiredoxin